MYPKITHTAKSGRKHCGREKDCGACNYRIAKSMCSCGHPGDGEKESVHGGVIGHGACAVCNCARFTWAGFYASYEHALKAAEVTA